MVFLFGASGQLGSAILKTLPTATPLQHNAPGRAIRQIQSHSAKSEPILVIFASGLTDPRCSYQDLHQANVIFPKTIIEQLSDFSRIRFLTFGTVLENFVGVCEGNPYLKTKLEFGDWISHCSKTDPLEGRLSHIRLQTLYSSKLKSHMFLGQIAEALKNKTVFKMTSGNQWREYQHTDDVAAIVQMLIQTQKWPTKVDLSFGQAFQLKDLAREIFSAFHAQDLLKIGALPEPSTENYSSPFPKTAETKGFESKNSLREIIRIMRESLQTLS